jgi:hypothetical protein
LDVWVIDRWEGDVANLSTSEHDAMAGSMPPVIDLDLAHPAYQPMLLKVLA